jgi:ABC-type phosphate transport system permease subunit
MIARSPRPRYGEHLIHGALLCCGALSIVTTLGIVVVLLVETVAFFQEV